MKKRFNLLLFALLIGLIFPILSDAATIELRKTQSDKNMVSYDVVYKLSEGETEVSTYILKVYNEFENRVEHLRYRNLSKPERIKNIIDRKMGRITKKEIMDICPDISKVTVERTLTDLVKVGYIVKVGSGPSTGYIRNN